MHVNKKCDCNHLIINRIFVIVVLGTGVQIIGFLGFLEIIEDYKYIDFQY